MIGNEFRRIALAQGLLPTVPPPALEKNTDPAPDRSRSLPPPPDFIRGLTRGPGGPGDNPAMAEQHAPNA